MERTKLVRERKWALQSQKGGRRQGKTDKKGEKRKRVKGA